MQVPIHSANFMQTLTQVNFLILHTPLSKAVFAN